MNVEEDELFERIKQFVAFRTGIETSTLQRQTKIESDLGMAGLDTITFYKDFFQEFQISCPEGFDFEKYVTSENLELKAVFMSLISKKHKEKYQVLEVSLAELEEVARTRIWRNQKEE